MDLNGENYSQISEEAIATKFQMYNGNIYYYKEDNGLMKLDPDDLSSELVSDKITSNLYNVTNKGIFFLDTNSMKICKISLKGKSYKELVDINTSNTTTNIIQNANTITSTNPIENTNTTTQENPIYENQLYNNYNQYIGYSFLGISIIFLLIFLYFFIKYQLKHLRKLSK